MEHIPNIIIVTHGGDIEPKPGKRRGGGEIETEECVSGIHQRGLNTHLRIRVRV
jgi:hypothetical protein